MRLRKANAADFSNDLSRLLDDLRDLVPSRAHEADSAASQLLSTAVTTLANVRSASSAAVQEPKAAAQAADAYVQDSPWRAVGGGLAVGVLLGFFLCGRSAR